MSDIKRIPLDRRVLIVREQRIDLRPERGAVLFPLIDGQPDSAYYESQRVGP